MVEFKRPHRDALWWSDYNPYLGNSNPHVIDRFEHGWPMAWNVRNAPYILLLRKFAPNECNCWALWNNRQIRWHALAVNAAAILALTAGCGAAFELWRRARRHWWQWHLRDLLAVVLLVSVAGAWYAAEQRRHAHELRVLGKQGRESDHHINSYVTTTGGITWLRELAGDENFEFLDRVIAVDVEPADLKRAANLPDLRSVRIVGDLGGKDLSPLEELPRLELLNLGQSVPAVITYKPMTAKSGIAVKMPRLASVRYLLAYHVDCQGLANLSSLEFIEWSGEPVEERRFREFAALPNLRELRLGNCTLMADGLSHLKSHPTLSRLTLSLATMDEHAMTQLGELNQLTELELTECAFHTAGLSQLSSLSRLEALCISGGNIDDKVVSHLAGLPNLRKLDLTGTSVTRAAIPRLSEMKQLRDLQLPRGFSSDDVTLLAREIPDCNVWIVPELDP